MEIKSDFGEMIFSSIEALFSIIRGKKLIFTSFRINVEKKNGKRKAKSWGILNFVFLRERRYTKILWNFSGMARISSYKDIQQWTLSGNNDGPLELTSGIRSPFYENAEKIMKSLNKNARSEDYEVSISWLMGNPKVLDYQNLTRLNNKPSFLFKID
ncbi:MAG: hypothetical protein AB1333_01225 [Patescibacteria group bacterium]